MSLERGWRDFPFKNVSLSLDTFGISLKIVQLSDLHITPEIDAAHIDAMVEQINQINPDLVLFSGDIIQSGAHKVQKQLKSFQELRAKSYYVTGNHDIVYGAKNLQSIMQKSGIELLDNRVVHLDIQGAKLQLVGLSDRYSFMRGVKRETKRLFASLQPELPTILLAHQPKDVRLIGERRVDLQLSGHTHGGQIYPFSLLVKLAQPYFSGLYRHNKTTLYVSNGIGYWGLQIRYKAPREIAVLTIN